MTNTTPFQPLTPEWSPDWNSQASFQQQNHAPIGADAFDFDSQSQGSAVSHGTPMPTFEDAILFPQEADQFPDASAWPAAGDAFTAAPSMAHFDSMNWPDLAPYHGNVELAERLEKADLSHLLSDALPSLSPTHAAAQSYPTPSSSSASPPMPQSSVPASQAIHVCTSCGLGFTKARQLQLHMDKHTLPHACHVCPLRHARKKDLHRHLWTHHETEARRLRIPSVNAQCPVRGCGFEGRNDNVKRHIKTKHRDWRGN